MNYRLLKILNPGISCNKYAYIIEKKHKFLWIFPYWEIVDFFEEDMKQYAESQLHWYKNKHNGEL